MTEQAEQQDPILAAALEYAARGWAVFPTGGPGGDTKAPHVKAGKWSQTSTSDPAEVAAVFTGLEGPVGIGLDCGKSGLVALDVDRPQEAPGALLTAQKSHWVHQGREDRWTLLMASDGSIRCPVRSWGEVKGAGGYIVLAPTVHPDTLKPYRWLAQPGKGPKAIPAEIAAELTSGGQPANEATQVEVQAFMDQHQRNLKRSALSVPVGMVTEAARAGRSLHPVMTDALVWAMEEAAAGAYPAKVAADEVHQAWLKGYATQGRQPRPDHRQEWASALRWAVGQVLDQEEAEVQRRAISLGLHLTPVASQEEAPEEVDLPSLPADFWDARTSLGHVRIAALSRGVGPDALLLATMVRAATMVDPIWLIPPTVGAPVAPHLFGGLVVGSGGGKSAAKAVAAELLPAVRHDSALEFGDDPVAATRGTMKTVTMGTAEGMVDAMGEGSGSKWEKRSWGLLVDSDEVDAFMGTAALGSGATAMLRSAWTGERIGGTFRNRAGHAAAHDYRLGLLVGVQPNRAKALISGQEEDGGTPQRFIWAESKVAGMVDFSQRLPWPGPLDLRKFIPGEASHGGEVITITDTHGAEVQRHFILLDEAVERQVWDDHHRLQMAGARATGPGHGNLVRLKVAMALGVLERGFQDIEVTEEDWTLAGVLLEVSNGVLEWMKDQARKGEAERKAGEIATKRGAERAAEDATARVAGVIQRGLVKHGPQTRAGVARMAQGKDRAWVDEALALLLAHKAARFSSGKWEAMD